MKLHRLPFLLSLACMANVPSVNAQNERCPASLRSTSAQQQQRIDTLLQRETQALDQFQQKLVPEIRCEYSDSVARQSCWALVTILKEKTQQSKGAIARYQLSDRKKPADLFNIYVGLETLLKDIESLASQDYFRGNLNQRVLAEAYNSFIKLTDVWFTGEMRETVRSLQHDAVHASH